MNWNLEVSDFCESSASGSQPIKSFRSCNVRLIMYSYYLSGGLAAVIYTDTLCTTLMTVGSLIVAIMGKTTLISITCFCSLENYIKDVNIVSSG